MRFQTAITTCVAAFAATAAAQDQLVTYFPGSVAGVGNLGATTFDANGDFWVISNDAFSGPFPVPRLSKVVFDGSSWTADPHVLDEDLRFFYRSSDGPAGEHHAREQIHDAGAFLTESYGPESFVNEPGGSGVLATVGITNYFRLSPGDDATMVSTFAVVPAPGTISLLAVAGLAGVRRRR